MIAVSSTVRVEPPEHPGADVALAFLCVVALLIVLFIAATIAFIRRVRRLRKSLARMTKYATSTVAGAPTSGVVELVGVVTPTGDGVLEAPFSGAPCVWWSVEISESKGSSIVIVMRTSAARDFYLDDGSGALARIRTARAKVALKQHSQNLPEQKERVRAFVEKHAIEKDVKDLLWGEDRIDLKTGVYVIGHASPPDADAAARAGPFRRSSAPSERIVVSEADDGEGELVVSVGHEAALAKELEGELADARREARGFAIGAVVLSLMAGGLAIVAKLASQ
jgi:hypothetical protein